MLKLLFDSEGEDLEADARRMYLRMLEKNNLPRMSGATRAMVPDWCDICGDRCWAQGLGGFALCTKCRGEGKLPIGFSA